MYYTHIANNHIDTDPHGFGAEPAPSYLRFKTLELSKDEITLPQYKHFQQRNNLVIELTKKIGDWLQNNQSSIRYKIFNIPKATGGFREIKAPEDDLKAFMREIKVDLERIGINSHDAAYAYITNRDCKKAIQRHQQNGSNWFLKMDIEKFFNNCSREVIFSQLRKVYPFSLMTETAYSAFATVLCNLSCYKNELPQGTPLSPLLTNWLMISVDTEITKALAVRSDQEFIYTRYADDLLISSKSSFKSNELVELVEAILAQEQTPFVVKPSKTRYGSKAGKNWNLGIMYNKDDKLTVGHKRKRRIKTMLFQFYQGQRDKSYAMELNGELAYLQNIEPEYVDYLITFMNRKYRYDFRAAIKVAMKQP